jgi:hypothetical protein
MVNLNTFRKETGLFIREIVTKDWKKWKNVYNEGYFLQDLVIDDSLIDRVELILAILKGYYCKACKCYHNGDHVLKMIRDILSNKNEENWKDIPLDV